MFTITLYTKKNCHLCEQVLMDLQELQAQIPHRVVEVDIDSSPTLLKKYLNDIPVIEVGNY